MEKINSNEFVFLLQPLIIMNIDNLKCEQDYIDLKHKHLSEQAFQTGKLKEIKEKIIKIKQNEKFFDSREQKSGTNETLNELEEKKLDK
jgi:hypothetical protein